MRPPLLGQAYDDINTAKKLELADTNPTFRENDGQLQVQAENNDLQNFSFPAKEKISGAFLERTEKNQSLFTRCLSDEAFRDVIETMMAQSLYDKIRKESAGEANPEKGTISRTLFVLRIRLASTLTR